MGRQETRGHILDVGLRLFGEKGYLDTTTKEIAKVSGVNEATLFHHFPDKKSLLKEIINANINFAIPELSQLNLKLKYQNLQQDLFELAVRYMEITMQNIHILRVFISRNPAYPDFGINMYYVLPALEEHFSSYIRKLVEIGLLPDQDYSVEQELYLSHITRIMLDIAAHDQIYELNKIVKNTIQKEAHSISKHYAEDIFA